MENKEGLCEAEVKKNLVLADIGETLTIPLATLNRSCHFRREWTRIQVKWHGVTKERRDYKRRPEIRAKMKKYQRRPEVKAMMKEYYQRPEVKARVKKYQNQPEIKERKKELQKRWNKMPKNIIKRRAYQRKRYWKMKENENGK